LKDSKYYIDCADYAKELYWNTFGKLRNIEVIKKDIEYTISKNRNGPERIFKVNIENCDVNERLQKIIADIKAGFIPDTLLISPNSKPNNIIELLIENGFSKDISGASMSMDLGNFNAVDLDDDNIIIKEVDDNEMLLEFIEIMNTELFECEVLTFDQFFDLMNLDYTRLYMTYYSNEPASVCLTVSDNEFAEISWVATRKKFRRKGLALKTLNKALDDLKYCGVKTVSLGAESMAIKLYEKAGFKEYSRRIIMKCDYSQVYKKTCCRVESKTINKAKEIFSNSDDVESFILEMQKQSIIGRKIWYEAENNEIFITKKYADECGGGCKENKSLIGQRCHCGYMNNSEVVISMDYCKCSAEFYRPIFEPILGEKLVIEPIETVLSGGKECTFVIKGFNEYLDSYLIVE